MNENLNTKHRLDPNLLKYDAVLKQENEKESKQKELNERIAPFSNIENSL